MTTTLPISPGQLLHQRYRLIESLGSGGFGQAFLVEDTQESVQRVVKHLKPASADPTFLQTARRLFETEAKTLDALGHHHQIPELFEAFEENAEFYLVQELIVGKPLSAEILPGKTWNEPQVIEMLQEVLSILNFVHDHGMIHRDIR
jgi:serine/threonine protein kinase